MSLKDLCSELTVLMLVLGGPVGEQCECCQRSFCQDFHLESNAELLHVQKTPSLLFLSLSHTHTHTHTQQSIFFSPSIVVDAVTTLSATRRFGGAVTNCARAFIFKCEQIWVIAV